MEDLPDSCLHAQHPAFTGDAVTAITSASLPSSHTVMPSVKDHHDVDIAARIRHDRNHAASVHCISLEVDTFDSYTHRKSVESNTANTVAVVMWLGR